MIGDASPIRARVDDPRPLDAIGDTWTRFWFSPADGRPLAAVRILSAALGLLLLWSFAADLQAWFGPRGVLPAEVVSQWRPRFGFSLFDAATTGAALAAGFWLTVLAFVLLLLGVGTPVVAVAAAVLWASLLHRGPMLAGPADDCLAVLLWCVAIGPSGRHWSVDRLVADRAGRPQPSPSVRARIALSLMQVHVAAIAAASVLAQLKGDAWWDGSAAWWLSARGGSALGGMTGPLARSEYLTSLLTHAIVACEVFVAIGIWFRSTRRLAARTALVAWPLIGLAAGEPLWGLAMAILAVPLADLPGCGNGSADAAAG
jgi:hypothetical protein